jgi:hypothetical protein
MAREEMAEIGATEEEEKAQDIVERLSKEETFIPEVIICDACHRGFLRWIRGGIDAAPIWVWPGMAEGYICGGPLRIVSRPRAIEIADKWEIENAGSKES